MASNNNRSRDTTGTLTAKKKECYTFEPQQWRRTVCKNCFRSLPDHPTEPSSNTTNNGKGISPRTSPLLGTKSMASSNSQSSSITGISKDPVLRKGETSPNTRRRPKTDEFKQKTPSPRESKRTMGSNTGRRSPANSPSSSVSRHSGSFAANRQNSTSSIDTKYVEELENDFFDLEDKYDDICKDKLELEKELIDKNHTNEDLLEDIETYKNKIIHFERRVQHLDEEVHNYRERLKLPESDQATIDVNDTMSAKHQEILTENEQLRVRMEEMEQLCQDVMEENDMLKEDQEEMQREIEEMHDHFQEDDTDTLRELKRDLETSNKNCRIFQFKLRKTERRYEQCENERSALEEKLNRLETQLYSENDVNLIRGLEEELRVAKEVSVRLNSELELVDEKRSYFEEDNKHLKEELKDSETRRRSLETELSKCRQEIEKLKSLDSAGALQIPDPASKRKARNIESLSREPSFEEQSLQRELDAAKERETDLNEQLKFAEDDIRKLKRRFNDIEEENDSLTKKLETIMKSTNLEDNEFEDNASAQALKIQVELLEQQNSALRKKFVTVEKENINLFNDMRQLKTKSSPGVDKSDDTFKDEKYKLLNTKIADLHADVERLEKENRRLTLLNSLQQSSSGVKSKIPQSQFPVETTTDFIQNVQIQELKTECGRLKEQIKQYDKQIKNVISQIEQQFGSHLADKRQLDYLIKYNELATSSRVLEKQILQMNKQIDSLKEDNIKYKEFYDKNCKLDLKSSKFCRGDAKSDLESASKSVLLEEIICLEDEIDELASKCEKTDSRIVELTKAISEKDRLIEEMISDNEKNEKELNQYIEHLLTKNTLLSDLLSCVETRANELQQQFDRMISPDESVDSSNRSSTTTTTTTTENASIRAPGQNKTSAFSAGSDDVFSEVCGYQIDAPGNLNDAEKIKFRFTCLEKLLSEERKRTRIAEKQVEMALKDSAHSRVNEDSQLKKKEMEMLKTDLEEKNEMLEEKEQQIQDLRTRLDQTRKMNEALRTLLDKQDEGVPMSSHKSKDSSSSKEQMIELNSYKKEIAALKTDIHQYAIKVNESEKIREKLAKEIRNLQAEMKVREEQIYEQDDEMRAKDHELKNVKRLLDETQNNLKTHAESNNSSKAMEEKIRKIDELTKRIEELNKNINSHKGQIEEQDIELKQYENQQKILTDSVRTRDERIREKDDLISHMNQRLQNREKELNDFDLLIKQANEKLEKNQETINNIQTLLSKKDVEYEALKSKQEELQTSYDNVNGNLNSMKKENGKLKSRISELEKEKSKPPPVPRISTGGPVDVDKLKLEISQLKKDKENLTAILNKDKISFSASRRDSDTAKSDSDSYMKAIQHQQYVTRVNLLTDNVMRLNRINIELKLQNEVIQNNMLEYQRKYKNIKEQHEAEQEAWLTERVSLCSRMKEYEDRKSVISSLRKSLQEVSLKVANLEGQLSKEKQESERKSEELNQVVADLQKKMSTYEDQQKLPKVLQRFGGKMTTRNVVDSPFDKEKAELKVRLETTDKLIHKLRTDIIEKDEKVCQDKVELLKKSEETRINLESQIQNLTDHLADMESFKEQCFMLKERIFVLEECQDRDRKVWNEERMLLLFRIENTRMIIENWLGKIRETENNETASQEEVLESLEKEIEKFLYSKESAIYSQIRRRLEDDCADQLFSSNSRAQLPSSQNDSAIESVPTSPACSNSLGKSPFKSVSLDWTNRMTKSQLTPDISTSNLSINTSQFMRSNRSVSPEHSRSASVTRKITNYPDPTPGFMFKSSSSRQNSMESVSKDPSDYSSRSFTLPGLRNIHSASRISPARQKFFESSPTEIKSPMKLEENNPEEKTLHLTIPTSPTNFNKPVESADSSKKLNKVIEENKPKQSIPLKPVPERKPPLHSTDPSKNLNIVIDDNKPKQSTPLKPEPDKKPPLENTDSSKKLNKVTEETKPKLSVSIKSEPEIVRPTSPTTFSKPIDSTDSSKKPIETKKVIENVKPKLSVTIKAEPQIVVPTNPTSFNKPLVSTDSTKKLKFEEIKPKQSAPLKVEPEPVVPTNVVTPTSPTSESKISEPVSKPVKSKSTSIAPSILQLRMKFAQKSSNSTSLDSSSSQKT